MKLYLSGPMSAYRHECYNFQTFLDAGDQLMLAGYEIICPARAELATGFDPCRDEFNMDKLHDTIKRDIAMLLSADAICMLPNWGISDGAKGELAVAAWAGMPGFLYEGSPEQLTSVCPSDILRQTGSVHTQSEQNESEDILEEALRITSKDRQSQYGPPNIDFHRTAKIWSALFGYDFQSWHVAVAMEGLKLSRTMHSPEKRDNWVDMAGYARCGYQCACGGDNPN